MPAIRNIAVGLPVKQGHVLALEGYDPARDLHFLRAIGGGIEFGETAVEALHREYTEELGVQLDSAEPLGVFENIFTYKGEPGHEIAHVYTVTCAALDAVPLDAVLEILDQGSPVRWVPIDEIRSGARILFPNGAPEALLALAER
ncbi:NUDIX domain-containing protein [Microbacterium sp. NPDC089695]|uniref:NUDIX domain-containing protein n=1 Tax=Microbacterium sp. NPDC089695 TaxID=3364198 RepID=UPI0037FB3948